MEQKEFNERVGKILGIKTAMVAFAVINMLSTDLSHPRVSLGVIPNKVQAKKLRELVFELGNFKEVI